MTVERARQLLKLGDDYTDEKVKQIIEQTKNLARIFLREKYLNTTCYNLEDEN